MHPRVAVTIKKKIEKYIVASFIIPIDYSPWIYNIVCTTKPNGEIICCTNFRDMNKVCPKHVFPLPSIDMIIDSITCHEILSFMDGFFSYNQIRIKKEDQHKLTFVTPWGKFCWVVMPFGLKNAGVTYQRAMVSMFHDMIHDSVEVHVDEILAKSITKYDHISNLRNIFQRMREYKLKLKP